MVSMPPEARTPEQALPIETRRKRANRILVVVAVLFVIILFLFWRGTWFGRPLSDAELSQYLSDKEKPRHSQHALVQIGERIARGDASVKRWYPQVISLASNPNPEIRVTLAWVMGGDNHSEDFHRALLLLLHDPEPLVRRNVALSLVRFGDASGKPELLNMLRPYTILASKDGVLHYRVKQGDLVNNGTVLAELGGPPDTGGIAAGEREPLQIRSPLPGKLQARLANDGARVSRGQEILTLSPGFEHVWEALRALYVIGTAEDLAEIERFATGSAADMPRKIQEQASLTAAEIRRRSHP